MRGGIHHSLHAERSVPRSACIPRTIVPGARSEEHRASRIARGVVDLSGVHLRHVRGVHRRRRGRVHGGEHTMLWVEFPNPREQGVDSVGDERGDHAAAESAAERGEDGVRIRLQRPGVTSNGHHRRR